MSVSFDTGSAFDVQNLSHAVSRIWEGIIVPFCIADYCLAAEPFDGEMVADDYEIPVIFVIKYVLLHTFIDLLQIGFETIRPIHMKTQQSINMKLPWKKGQIGWELL